ncbi:MAG: DUF5320 domain-containing protein, partial [Elusimicrobia bacterium]|nr:DUF5320 domain-containing protein [Elusimicrobiota bacterium]
ISEKEIRDVFTANFSSVENTSYLKNDNILKDKEIKLLKERIEFLEQKNKFLEKQLNDIKNNI